MGGEENPEAVLATGRTSEIHPFGPDKVLKLFVHGTSDEEIDAELRNGIEAHMVGATPIACHGRADLHGTPGIIFDRLTGGSLTEMAEKNLLLLRESGRQLARGHAALHECKSRAFTDVREATVALLDQSPMQFLDTNARAHVAGMIEALPSGDAVLHMDFHTNNVFRHNEGLAVIDWQTPLSGTPAADVAMSLFLLSEAELWPGITLFQKLLYNTVRRILKGAYLREYLAITGMSQSEIDAWRIVALVNRLASWNIASERPTLMREIRQIAGAES